MHKSAAVMNYSMENSKDSAFSSWEVEDSLQSNSIPSSLLWGSMTAKEKKIFCNLIEYKQHSNESKSFIVGKITWYLKLQTFPYKDKGLC